MAPRIKRTLAMTARAACVAIVALFSSPGRAAEVNVLSAAASNRCSRKFAMNSRERPDTD